jgi:RNA polymerase sigma-70 factor (ECF subfamily)
MTQAEETMLRDLKSGDSEAFTQVVEEHTEVLLRGALGRGLSMVDAEELVQDTFVAFLDAVKRFEGRSSVRTFLFGILYRKAMERGRKRSRELATDPIDQLFESRCQGPNGHWSSPPKGPDEEVLTKEVAGMIEGCMGDLTEDQRSAFHLKEVDRVETKDLCNILDVTATHLRVLLFRARNKLRECLEKKWENK